MAPNRGCSPTCVLISINSEAMRTPRTAASITSRGLPANVTTVLLVALAGIDIEEFHAIDRFDRVGDLVDEIEIVALAEVGDAFDQRGHGNILTRLELAHTLTTHPVAYVTASVHRLRALFRTASPLQPPGGEGGARIGG